MENKDTIVLSNLQNESIRLLKNKDLLNFVQYKLGYMPSKKEDLLQVRDIILDGKTISGLKNKIFFDELSLFPNLEEIEVHNATITFEDVQKLREIPKIAFQNCIVDTINPLKETKHLALIGSNVRDIENIKNMSNLISLELINVNIVDFNFIKYLVNLKKLIIKNIPEFSMDKLNFILPIEYLSIEDVNELSLKILQNFKHLKTLSIDRLMTNKWKTELEMISEQGVKILLNDIYEY